MNDEIKEIDNSDLMELLETTSKKDFYRLTLAHELVVRLYNWITNSQQEIERLNNIINELEKWLEYEANFWKQQQEEAIKNGWLEFGGKYNTTIIYENAINKLKKLKEGKE